MGELTNQIYLYSLETKDFYTEEENELNNLYFEQLILKKQFKEESSKLTKKLKKMDKNDENYIKNVENIENCIKEYEIQKKEATEQAKYYKTLLNEEIKKFPKDGVRQLRREALKINNKVGLFESSLTRTCRFKTNKVTEEMFIIRIFHYDILESIIHNGFEFEGEKFIYFTSSAGQIRTKKIVTIKESLYRRYELTITNGLTVDVINSKGGINTNKYQAYLALANSASNTWKRFNIDRAIVVDDMCTNVTSEVDYIKTFMDDEEYIEEENFKITRQVMDIPIEHMDGCGIMLPSVSKKTFMFRMPWMKGMLTPFDFRKFIELNKASTKVTDIYGKEWDIIEDDIRIILTKSQFKMWKFYSSWDDYKKQFRKNKCEACRFNEEDIKGKANINYQMLQTLTSMTKDDLEKVAQETVDDIINIGNDKSVMLKCLGVNKYNKSMNYFQKSLLLYPELLSDSHSREVIKSKKRSMVRDGRAGKLTVNGYYTYLIPDVYAFSEWLFLGDENPKGLLENGQVHCKIHNEGEVDVLRAPHLYREHAIRNNTFNDTINEWFTTKGVYTSVHDPVSKILMFDNDGDCALVLQDETIIRVAKEDCKDVVPLYYVMKKADDELLTNERIYTALTSAYKANIGIISNEITKIWNTPNPNVDAVKWLCAINNYVIDFAKTLYLPKKSERVDMELKRFSKMKLPHFFKYAKDKEDKQVHEINDSTVNKLEYIIPNKPIEFKKVVGYVNHKILMNNPYPVHDLNRNEEIINKFIELNRFKLANVKFEKFDAEGFINNVKEELLKIYPNEVYITDVLVDYFFKTDSAFKKTLWDCYGEYIYNNLLLNIGNTICCERCNKRAEKTSNKSANQIYCEKCSEELKKEKIKMRVAKHRKNVTLSNSSES